MATQPGRRRLVALSVAGSDNSAGAGIQADLKVFAAHGCYGLTAVTCVVSEVPGRVEGIQPVRPGLVAGQIALSREAFPVAAAKTGMLYSAGIVAAVAEALRGARFPIIVDPVMVASSGDPLLLPRAVSAYRTRLFPLATLVTPNLDELGLLAGRKARDLNSMKECGRALADRHGCAFLLKGGHLEGRLATDILVHEGGIETYEAPFVKGGASHGTGCAYSAAITANLAAGIPLPESVARAKDYITAAIRESLRWGRVAALEHFPGNPSPTLSSPAARSRPESRRRSS